jgi:glyoxylase-like metal-dependent hydrolase (beta-lactamase superfamily II)
MALRQARAANRSPMTLDGTRTFVVGSRRPVVIDPGPADEEHLRAVEKLLAGAVPTAILLTHAHADHSGNAEALAMLAGAPIGMGRGARRLPFPETSVGRWLADGDEVECDAGIIRVVKTPGHTPEHLAFYWETGEGAGTLFAGDLFLGVGDTTLVSAPEGNLQDYLQSLEVISELDPTVIYPAHGPALRRPEAAVSRYVRHRLRRIEQVKEAQAINPGATAEELVEPVYGADLDPRLRSAALGSIAAVFEYLEAGGAEGPVRDRIC